MSRYRLSVLDRSSNGDRALRDLIVLQQVNGIVTLLLGVSQVLFIMHFMGSSEPDVTTSSLPLFVLGGGGWALIGIGVNLFKGKEAFDGGWIESERVMWVWTIGSFIFALGVAVWTVLVVLP